jgi:hypothetical protein
MIDGMIGGRIACRSDEIDWFVDTFELVIQYDSLVSWIIPDYPNLDYCSY